MIGNHFGYAAPEIQIYYSFWCCFGDDAKPEKITETLRTYLTRQTGVKAPDKKANHCPPHCYCLRTSFATRTGPKLPATSVDAEGAAPVRKVRLVCIFLSQSKGDGITRS